MAYNNNMTGILYKNEYKKTPKQPDYTGHFEIDGVKYRQAFWLKTDSKGKPFMSQSISLDGSYVKKDATPTIDEVKDELDDFVPF